MRNAIIHAAVTLLALTGTATRAAAPITEAGAAKIADATISAWMSGNAARIKALYAPNIVGFDMTTAPLATDRATWDKLQDGFAAAGFDRSVRKARSVQILDADTFVVSGSWDIKSSADPAKALTARCTDVYHKTGAEWPIVTEHCSIAPTG